jgi:hypothetical protein
MPSFDEGDSWRLVLDLDAVDVGQDGSDECAPVADGID